MPKKPSLRLQALYPVFDSHGYYSEGGRKIHVQNEDTDKTLCGRQSWFNSCDLDAFGGDVLKYMAQPDPDNEICKVCKRIFIKDAL